MFHCTCSVLCGYKACIWAHGCSKNPVHGLRRCRALHLLQIWATPRVSQNYLNAGERSLGALYEWCDRLAFCRGLSTCRNSWTSGKTLLRLLEKSGLIPTRSVYWQGCVCSHQPSATQQKAMSISPIARLTARPDCNWWSLASLFDDGWRVYQNPRPTYPQCRTLRLNSPL